MDWDDFTDKLSNVGDRVGRTLKRVFGSRNERYVRTLDKLIAEIAGLEPWAQGLTAEQFKSKTEEFRGQLAAGSKTLDQILPEAFALVRSMALKSAANSLPARAWTAIAPWPGAGGICSMGKS